MVSTLNQKQEEAVKTTEGPVLIVAGPGTGKTKTLVERTVYLIQESLAKPDEITLTTFTNNAAWELRQRIGQSLESERKGGREEAGQVHIGNFHQIAREILDQFPEYLPYRPFYKQASPLDQLALIIKYWDQFYRKGQIKALFPRAQAKPAYYPARDLARFFNKIREGFCDLSRVDGKSQLAFQLLSTYQEVLVEENLLDYSGLLQAGRDLLRDHEDVRKVFQARAKYFMVDEYQDTNPIQEEMVALLSGGTGNLCVVGDDDQSLYRFRGAYVGNLLGFQARYPGAVRINLEENYRSDGRILSFASDFINHPYQDMEAVEERISDHRFRKHLRPTPATGSHRSAVQALTGPGLESWADGVVGMVKELRTRLSSYKDMVILAHSLSSPEMVCLSQKLRQAQVPSFAPRQSSLLARQEVARLIACLYQAFSPWLDSLYGQRPGLREDLDWARWAGRLPVKGREDRAQLVANFQKDLVQGQASLLDLAYAFLQLPPFKEILSRALVGGQEAKNQAKSLAVFMTYIHDYEINQDQFPLPHESSEIFNFCIDFFGRYLSFLRLAKPDALGGTDPGRPEDDRLELMTIHQSKGLEFPVVILVEPRKRTWWRSNRKQGVDLLPRNPALGPALDPDLEEDLDQSRLYYTAMTRAKNLLVLTGIQDERLVDNFFALNPLLPAWQPGKFFPLEVQDQPAPSKPRAYAYTTDISAYQACPRRWFFFQDLAFPERNWPAQAYGSLVHQGLKEIHREVLAGQLPSQTDLQVILDHAFQGLVQAGFPVQLEDKKKALASLTSYLDKEGEDLGPAIFAAEKKFRKLEGDYFFQGTLDLLTKDGGIIDFKTGKREEEKEMVYRDQLLFYRTLVGGEGKNILYYLDEEDPIQTLAYKQEDLNKFSEQMDQVMVGIKGEDYRAKAENTAICPPCPFAGFCWPKA